MQKSINSIYILMTIAAFFWAGAFIAGKFGVNEFSAISLTFFRFLFASIIIFIIMVSGMIILAVYLNSRIKLKVDIKQLS